MLPSHLFERILLKAKEIRWHISYECLEKLLGYRDVLSWKNIDVSLFFLEGDVLKVINQVMFPIKTLSISLNNISDEEMKNLYGLAPTIEVLKLSYYSRSTQEFLNAPFPKLQKLHLKGYGPNDINLDFKCFADTLEEFIMEGDRLSESSIKSLASLKQLKVLSILQAYRIWTNDMFFGVLSSMTSLRTLDFRKSLASNSQLHLKLPGVISNLPHLENIDVSFNESVGKEWILQLMKCKKWKRFGMYFINSSPNEYHRYNDFKPWAEEIFGKFEETRLSTCENYVDDYRNLNDVPYQILYGVLPRNIADQLPRVENVLLRYYEINLDSLAVSIIKLFLDTGRFTQDFIRKLINIVSSYFDPGCNLEKKVKQAAYNGAMSIIKNVHVSRAMLNIITKESNKGLSIKILSAIFVSSIKSNNYQTEIKKIDSKNVCSKALQEGFINEDVLIVMKKLLEKICMSYVV